MEQNSILDRYQKRFLGSVIKEPYLLKHFYWTGGTALAEFYLHHRESYDIDLFSENEIHLPSIEKFVHAVKRTLGASDILHKRFLGLQSFVFKYPKGELKVDFNYYPFPRINVGKRWNGLAIDSLEDIAANKIHTVSMKPRDRDFVDIYCMFQKEQFSIEHLISLAKAKFDWHIDPIQLGQTFTQVGAYQDIPKMLIPFDHQKMERFFLGLAKQMEKDIFQ